MGGLNIKHIDKKGKLKGEIKVYRDNKGGHKEFVDAQGKVSGFQANKK